MNLDGIDNRPSLETVFSTAALYDLADDRAEKILDEVTQAVAGWRDIAKRTGIASADIELMAPAFIQENGFIASSL